VAGADPEEGINREEFIALYAQQDFIDKIPLHFSVMVQDEFRGAGAGGRANEGSRRPGRRGGGDADSLENEDDV
jgi:hypothetical protein